MPIIREVKIVKVPLTENERLPDYPKNFPKMPIMYLELLENKAKIKQDLINKEYKPENENLSKGLENIGKTQNKEVDKEVVDKEVVDKEVVDKEVVDKKSINISDTDSEYDKRKDSDYDSDSEYDKRKDSDYDSDSDYDKRKDSDYDSDSEYDKRKDSDYDKRKDSDYQKNNKNSDSDSDALSSRLNELLGDTEDKTKIDKYSKETPSIINRIPSKSPYEKYKNIQETKKAPPTLSELEAKGFYTNKPELRDINHITTSEYEEEDKKREIIFKFDLLKKSYPLAAPTIPQYTIHSDYKEMHKTYDMTVRRLSLDSTVENYKTYLIGGFMIIEFAFGNFLGFDMQGFTQQQIVGMHSYEKLLIEIGEKSYVPSGSKWPVEIRLLFIIILNAGIFIVGKMILRKTGANVLSMMNGFSNNTTPAQPVRPKRKMKGPSVNLDEIPDVEEEKSINENSNN